MKHRMLTLLLAASLLFNLGACGKTEPAGSTAETGVPDGREVIPAQARVSYLGPQGTYTEEATQFFFPETAVT